MLSLVNSQQVLPSAIVALISEAFCNLEVVITLRSIAYCLCWRARKAGVFVFVPG
jgi:hypothetical protein